MGIGRLKYTGFKVGEFTPDTNTTYYGGSPIAINKSGKFVLAKRSELVASKSDSTATSYVGIAYNPSGEDQIPGSNPKKFTYLPGPSVVTLQKNAATNNNTSINNQGAKPQTGDDYPYDTTLSWAIGDQLYIDNDGKWTNTPVVAGDSVYGLVIGKGTNYLDVQMYAAGQNPY